LWQHGRIQTDRPENQLLFNRSQRFILEKCTAGANSCLFFRLAVVVARCGVPGLSEFVWQRVGRSRMGKRMGVGAEIAVRVWLSERDEVICVKRTRKVAPAPLGWLARLTCSSLLCMDRQCLDFSGQRSTSSTRRGTSRAPRLASSLQATVRSAFCMCVCVCACVCLSCQWVG
jgi:hypothetical protein